MKKLLLLPTFLALTSCGALQCPGQQKYTQDSFWDNPRIIFRNVLVPPNGYSDNEIIKPKVTQHKSTFHIRKKKLNRHKQTLSFNNEAYITRAQYGSSANNDLNGVTKTYVPPISMQPTLSITKNIQNVGLTRTMPAIISSNQAKPSEQQADVPTGTTYVPLTFPVPPPKSMMQQFHMQIGSGNN